MQVLTGEIYLNSEIYLKGNDLAFQLPKTALVLLPASSARFSNLHMSLSSSLI